MGRMSNLQKIQLLILWTPSKNANMHCLTLSFLLALPSASLAQMEFRPTYQEIVTHYFSHYLEPEEGDEGRCLQFPRRADGYYAEKSIYFANPDAVELLYDFESHRAQLRFVPRSLQRQQQAVNPSLISFC